jgi:hypothetical protein
MPRAWGGSIIKFRGLGGKWPLGKMYRAGRGAERVEAPPADALKLTGKRVGATGALWAYGGISNQQDVDCTCNHSIFHLDLWARSWVPNNAVSGVMVIDSNGNRIMRMGKYGNVDDTEADLKEKEDGLRFAYIRACGATDTAAYVLDQASSRILKAALSYHAEETVSLDSGSRGSAPTPASAARTPEAKPAAGLSAPPPSSAAAPPAASPASSPAVVCRGWWSLAMSYKRAGRKDKAREYLRKIIESYPTTEYAARAKRELAEL